jgi:hypothetical protein
MNLPKHPKKRKGEVGEVGEETMNKIEGPMSKKTNEPSKRADKQRNKKRTQCQEPSFHILLREGEFILRQYWQLITFKVFMIPSLVNLHIKFLNKSFQIGHMMPFIFCMTHLSV